MNTHLRRSFTFAATALLGLALAPTTSFATVTWDLSTEFSGGATPNGSVELKFVNAGTDTVTFTVTSLLTDATSFIESVYINFDPTKLATSLGIVQGSGPTATISKGLNQYKADGDGKYDILFEFPTDNATNFKTGSAVFTITGSGINENSFSYLSLPAGGNGPFLAASHVQGITVPGVTDTKSGWITLVPEPASITLWGMLTFCAAGGCWRQSRRRRIAEQA